MRYIRLIQCREAFVGAVYIRLNAGCIFVARFNLSVRFVF